MSSDKTKSNSLQLLRDMQRELAEALNALGGRQGEGLLQQYIFYSAVFLNRACEAYIYLRESCRIDGSKLLIRAALEAMIRMQAVRKESESMFRIAFTEFQEDKKWARSLSRPDADRLLHTIESDWQEFKRTYECLYPEHTRMESELTLRGAAELADLAGYYDSHYRLYCRFTHAAFRASTGDLSRLDSEDNRTMSLCSLVGINALAALGASTPNLQQLEQRFSSQLL